MEAMIENNVIRKEVNNKTIFSKEHFKLLEKFYGLTTEQTNGLDVVTEDISDVLETFDFAWQDGETGICYKEYDKCEMLVRRIREHCEELNVYYEIRESEDEFILDLLPSNVHLLDMRRGM
ncbi:hypothetical protein [Paenibacillus sp. FSL L8-0709]|uniref:hypothetical protein n=1 Tax=Paenibacillus sp. FSL L8-0709 TaxID=2975312 RepID=UPI0030F9C8F7